ncbi:hypothetical protein CLV96_3295 [Leptospira meyeri]|uniref:Uncharacterized protein n=1 Tax=Leptospira meyeri TaxID=29508 RepID=A0A4R8MQH0_LEPME|nr:hypothetical protein [Leptospira meyeri]EKJ87889.1 hypothetical protein LEP1GSC017_0505 [Leptospira meyeri serovar Hardjo str. Went 5]TDY67745.1 hypothetical protein CLV96_3295 [Leptospira meyeri]TGL52036.1 hypothetical protein EHQ55_03535 [Leptospira meyeri]
MKLVRWSLFLSLLAISPLLAQSTTKEVPISPQTTTETQNPKQTEETLDKERWRLLFYAGAGKAEIQTNPNIPFAHRDPNTGLLTNPGIGKKTGLTNAGTTNFPSEGSGTNQGTVFTLTNDKWLFAYGYTSIDLKMSPANQGLVPIQSFDSASEHVVRNIRVDYTQKISDLVSAVFSVRQFLRTGNYEWNNVLETTNVSNHYVAFPKIQVNDSMKINIYSLGFKFNYFKNWEIEPYFQYRDARFYANVFSTVGITQRSDNLLLPSDPEAIGNAWAYKGLGSAYALPLYNSIEKEFGNVGLRLQYNPYKFLFLRSDVRRNPILAAWEVRGSVTVFLSKYFGITAGGVYAEAEINPLSLRGWEIGPTFTYLF